MRIDPTVMVLALASLGACSTSGTGTQVGSSMCKPDAARDLAGISAPDDTEILGRTGGTTVRRIAHGDPTTKDFRIERVTVSIADGRIVAASCG